MCLFLGLLFYGMDDYHSSLHAESEFENERCYDNAAGIMAVLCVLDVRERGCSLQTYEQASIFLYYLVVFEVTAAVLQLFIPSRKA